MRTVCPFFPKETIPLPKTKFRASLGSSGVEQMKRGVPRWEGAPAAALEGWGSRSPSPCVFRSRHPEGRFERLGSCPGHFLIPSLPWHFEVIVLFLFLKQNTIYFFVLILEGYLLWKVEGFILNPLKSVKGERMREGGRRGPAEASAPRVLLVAPPTLRCSSPQAVLAGGVIGHPCWVTCPCPPCLSTHREAGAVPPGREKGRAHG